ncbi:MAG: methionine ABC transporter ATP-binding protein [Sarcina sp.]
MIKIMGLKKKFDGREVIKGVDIEIKRGEVYGLIGHSGAGKSTILRCINGLEKYDSGTLNVMGKEVEKMSKKELREFRKNLGMIFQGFNLLSRKTVFENIAIPLEIWGYSKEKINTKVRELIKLVGLEGREQSKPRELSGGQKQRVAIARALSLEPKILLSDEATSALDPSITKDVLELLLKINKELNITIVIVTHQMEVVRAICQRVSLIENGYIKAQGDVESLFLNPSLSLKKFLGEENETILPTEGINIKIFFPSSCSENTIITRLARDLNVDFSIVWGKLEKFRENVLGSLVINIKETNKKEILEYLNNKNITVEVLN